MFHNAVVSGVFKFPGKKSYEGELFNIISITRRWVGVKFPVKSVM